MENALWGADVVQSNEEPINYQFVTAIVKGDVSRGKRTKAGSYMPNTDYPGFDIKPCGSQGCVLPSNATHKDCEIKCNHTVGCAGYVYADSDCSGKPGPLCWTKSTMHAPSKGICRASRDMGSLVTSGHWSIKGGNAQAGMLKVYWDGKRAPGYAPMHKQGAIILGIGGDNSDGAVGTFYEGIMTTGYASAVTDDAVQKNIIAACYGK